MATIAQIEAAIANAQAAGDVAAVGRLTKLLAAEKAAGAEQGGLSASQVITGAVKNTPRSAMNLVNDYAQAILNPIDTADTMLDLAAGGISRGIEAVAGDQSWLPENKATATADAVGNFYKDRYGSWEGVKRSIANDPVGVLADISVPLTGGGSALARAPGTMGRVGAVVRSAGRMADPITHVPEVARVIGRRAANFAGVQSGAGSQAIFEGYDAARAGGDKSKAFYANMRGEVPQADVIGLADAGLSTIERNRRNKYRQDIQSTKQNPAMVDIRPIVKVLNDTLNDMMPTGNWEGGATSQRTAKLIVNDITKWANTPGGYTPWGLDSLKKRIRSYFVTPGPNVSTDRANANRIVETITTAIEDQIKKADPNYASTMESYKQASDLIRELKKTFSLTDTASNDTTLRKLQSTMRNNVQTNYGERINLARELEKAGADTLMPSLAGQALSSAEPRGIVRGTAGQQSIGTGALSYIAGFDPVTAALLAGGTWTASIPRVAGEIAGLLGTTARGVDAVANVAPPKARKAVKVAMDPLTRGPVQEAGAIANEADAMMTDAKGNVYDRKGRLIRRASE